MKNNDIIHIVFGIDHNYVMPCGIAILSICINTSSPVTFHILMSNDVSSEDISILQDMVKTYHKKISFYNIDTNVFNSLPENNHIKKSTYNRLLIPHVLPTEINKAIYLDADILTHQSLQPLWDIPLNENTPLAAAIDFKQMDIILHNSIDTPLEQTYYNAGVLLINNDYWRKFNIPGKCITYINNTQCQWMDQDAINHILGKDIIKLNTRYNLQTQFLNNPNKNWPIEKKLFDEVYQAISDPVITHFSTEHKPWHIDYKNNDEWIKYQMLSPWKKYPLVVPKKKKAIYTASLIDTLQSEDIEIFEKYAPAYIYFFKKTIHKHNWLLWTLNKLLWIIIKIIR